MLDGNAAVGETSSDDPSRDRFGVRTCRRGLAFLTSRHYFTGVMSIAAGAVARWIAPFVAVATVAGLVSAGAVHVGAAPEVRLVDAGNPLAGQPFYVDPASAAMAAARNANPPSPQLTAVANTPQAYWLDQAFPAGSVGARVAGYTGAAQAAGSMPIFALYGIPHRDCGSYASGGFASGADYRQWIDSISSGLGGSPAAIIVEPDALDMADCLSADQRQERFDLIRYAVDTPDPRSGRGRLRRRRTLAVVECRGNRRQAQPGRCWPCARVQSQRLELLQYRRGNRLRRGDFGDDERCALRNRHLAQRRRTGARLRTELVQPRRACPGHPAHHGYCGRARRRLSLGQTSRRIRRIMQRGPSAGHFVSQYAIDLAQNAGQ